VVVGIAASLALVSACGSSSKSSSDTGAATTAAPAKTEAPAATEAPATTEATATTAAGGSSAASGTAVVVATSPLGQILTDAKGYTLYAFMKDTAGTPTCTGGCAANWPAATTTSDQLPAGLDAKVFSVVEAPGDVYQLKAGQWPLYTFAGDTAPGQTNGQGVTGNWFVVAPDGSPIKG
jgi:predicted lipoprotein with Yx(FWY)xxD motif